MADYELSGPNGGDTPDSVSRMSALDLYEDLLIEEDKYVENRVYTMQEILEEKRLLEQQNASLLNQVVESKVKIKKMEAEKLALQQHFDSLLATARVELNRKNMLLHQHLDGRVNSLHQPAASKVVRSKSTGTHFTKKKNLAQLYKGKRVPEDELGPTKSRTFEDESTSQHTPSKTTTGKKNTGAFSSPDKISVHREATLIECRPAPSLISSEKRTVKYDLKKNELESVNTGTKECKTTSEKTVSTKTKDSTLPVSSMSRKNSVPRDATSRKIIKDSPVSITTTARRNSVPCDQTSGGHHVTRFSALNEQPMTKYSHTDKIHTSANSSIPPMDLAQNEVDKRSARTNVTRFNHTSANNDTVPSRAAVILLNAKGSDKERRNKKYSSKQKGVHNDPCESQSHLSSPPPKSSSHSNGTATSLISGSLMLAHSSRKDPSLKVKETGKHSKSTLIKSNSRKRPNPCESISQLPITTPKSSLISGPHVTDTAHVSVSLTQKEHNPSKDPSSKVKEAVKRTESTATKSDSKKQSEACESRVSNTPPKSSSFSHSHVTDTSHISGSLMQKVRTPKKYPSVTDFKVKDADNKYKSTMIKSNLKKLSVNPGHSSIKHKKRIKSYKKIIRERNKQIESQSISETSPLHDISQHNTNKLSSVALQNKQYPSDIPGLPINTSVCPPLGINTSNGVKALSAKNNAPISHAVKIKQTNDEKNSSTSSMKRRKLSIDSVETSSSYEEIDKEHLVEPHEVCGSNNSVQATTVKNDKLSPLTSTSVGYPTDLTKLPTYKPVCNPFNDPNKDLLNRGGTSSNLMIAGNAPCLTDVEPSHHSTTSKGVSKSNDDELQIRSPQRPELMSAEKSTLQSSPMSASVRDDLKLVIKTGGSTAKPLSYSAGKIPASFQPHVCLVDIKSKGSPLKKRSSLEKDSKSNLETAEISQPVAVCRKRKFLQQLEKDTNTKKWKPSEMCGTNETETTTAALPRDPEPLEQESDLIRSVKPAVHSSSISDTRDMNNLPGLKSLHQNATVNITCDAKKKSPAHSTSETHHQESKTSSKNSNADSALASNCSVKAHMSPDLSNTISTMSNQKLEGFTSISVSTPSSKAPTAPCSLNTWLASRQIERQNNNYEKPRSIVALPVSTQNADDNLIHREITSVGEESVTKQTQCNGSSKSKHYRNAALQWLICLAVEEFKATEGLTHHPHPLFVSNGYEEAKLAGSEGLLKAKTTASRSVWLSSLTKCQERRKENAKWSS